MKKIVIANRGEVAVRIIRACRLLGMSPIAIYHAREKRPLHVRLSDEAYCLGEGDLSDTYLCGEKIVGLAKKAGAHGIHPGYGFLSENASFAGLVRSAGIVFIGPGEKAIELMGDKIASKKVVEKLGVPLLTGYHGEDQSEKKLLKEAKKIGYPLLLKASSGGGGRGMRIVDSAKNFLSSLESAKRESLNAFGSDHILMEKYIASPRHIEVQVLCDNHGRHVHLFERECSIQRRYQKIIEETPSPAVGSKLRSLLCEDALKIARKIDYRGLGTVEFILDEEGRYYFLEMNTRLQVEHPVTEMVTGLDLVRLSIEIAFDKKLPFSQKDIRSQGHSMEVRMCAEDADNNFFPCSGTVIQRGTPEGAHLRLDAGYETGDFVGVDFDSLTAKLISWGESREDAIKRLIKGFEEVPFLGLTTNRAYLTRILQHREFQKGNLSTSFIKKYADDLKPGPLTKDQKALIVAAFLTTSGLDQKSTLKKETPWDSLKEFRNA